jgi:hypothetical protein
MHPASQSEAGCIFIHAHRDAAKMHSVRMKTLVTSLSTTCINTSTPMKKWSSKYLFGCSDARRHTLSPCAPAPWPSSRSFSSDPSSERPRQGCDSLPADGSGRSHFRAAAAAMVQMELTDGAPSKGLKGKSGAKPARSRHCKQRRIAHESTRYGCRGRKAILRQAHL